MTARPWELEQGTRPWEMPQGIFIRTIEIHRIATPADQAVGTGDIGYVGTEQGPPLPDQGPAPIGTTEGEVVLYTGVIAAIQATSAGRASGPLPADVVWKPTWTIYVSSLYLPQNAVRDRDLIVDDAGYRYAVTAADWESLGWKLLCQRLEA